MLRPRKPLRISSGEIAGFSCSVMLQILPRECANHDAGKRLAYAGEQNRCFPFPERRGTFRRQVSNRPPTAGGYPFPMKTDVTIAPSAGLFCIVLAAGTSSRFGTAKQLAPYLGQPLVTRATRLAEQVFGQRSILVAGHEWRRVASACEPQAGYLVVNEEFHNGLSASIAAGVGAVADTASGVLLLLADQPLIDAACLRALIASWEGNADCIVASDFDDTIGPPVIFPARFFDALTSLRGDRGARQILQDPASPVIRLACAAASVDIDEPGDLAALAN
jgi:molybdenum cofactor cytidylyltransferase